MAINNTVDNSFGAIGNLPINGLIPAPKTTTVAPVSLLNPNNMGVTNSSGIGTTIGSSSGTMTTPNIASSQAVPQTISTPISTGGLNTYGLTSSSPNWYQLQPGETTANYYQRTQGQTQSQALAGNTGTGNITGSTTASSGAGTGGGAAPTGMEYNAQGQLVPITTGSPGTTFNTNSYNATAPTYAGLVGGLTGMASQPTTAYTNAQNQYNQAAQQLAALQTQEAQQNANIQGSRTNLAEAGGETGIMQNLAAGSQAALTGEMTAEQAAMQNATAQQATQQSGLTAAGNLTAPQAANPYGTYSPTTLQYSQYGGGTGGGAATAGGVQAQVAQGAAVQNMQGILSQAQGLSSTLSDAITSSGYNPNDLSVATTFANGVNQWLQKNSGNPQYQNVANLISEVANKYAAILNQSGGTPTSVSQVQQQIINGLASGQQIQAILGNLDTNAQTSIKALQSASQTNSAGTTNGTTDTSNIYSW